MTSPWLESGNGTGLRLALFATLCLPCSACYAELSQRLALRQRAAGPDSSMSRQPTTAHHPGRVMSHARGITSPLMARFPLAARYCGAFG